MKNTLIAVLVSTALFGCGEVSTQNQVDESMRIAKKNAEFNAGEYLRTNPRFSGEGWVYVARADSFQDISCPQGDGWADVSFMRSNNASDSHDVERWPGVCSTMNQDLGCYLNKDLSTKPEITRQFNVCKAGYVIRQIAGNK